MICLWIRGRGLIVGILLNVNRGVALWLGGEEIRDCENESYFMYILLLYFKFLLPS